jgi:hypothetical protein
MKMQDRSAADLNACVKAGCFPILLSHLGRDKSEGAGGGNTFFNRLLSSRSRASRPPALESRTENPNDSQPQQPGFGQSRLLARSTGTAITHDAHDSHDSHLSMNRTRAPIATPATDRPTLLCERPMGAVHYRIIALCFAAWIFDFYDLILYYKFYLQNILPFDVVWLNYILLGIIVMVILVFRPQGLIPEKPLKATGATKSPKQ